MQSCSYAIKYCKQVEVNLSTTCRWAAIFVLVIFISWCSQDRRLTGSGGQSEHDGKEKYSTSKNYLFLTSLRVSLHQREMQTFMSSLETYWLCFQHMTGTKITKSDIFLNIQDFPSIRLSVMYPQKCFTQIIILCIFFPNSCTKNRFLPLQLPQHIMY